MSLGALGLVAGPPLAAVFAAAGNCSAGSSLRSPHRAPGVLGAPRPLVGPDSPLGLPLGEARGWGRSFSTGRVAADRRSGSACACRAPRATAIAVSLVRGRRPDCALLLASWTPSWYSSKTLARNAALAGVAALAPGVGIAGETPSGVGLGDERLQRWRPSAMVRLRGSCGTRLLWAIGASLADVLLWVGRSCGSSGRKLRLAEAGIDVDEPDAAGGAGARPGYSAPASSRSTRLKGRSLSTISSRRDSRC